MPGWQAWQTADAVRTLIPAPLHSYEPSVSSGLPFPFNHYLNMLSGPSR
jgi:hypothetical protein